MIIFLLIKAFTFILSASSHSQSIISFDSFFSVRIEVGGCHFRVSPGQSPFCGGLGHPGLDVPVEEHLEPRCPSFITFWHPPFLPSSLLLTLGVELKGEVKNGGPIGKNRAMEWRCVHHLNSF